MRRAAWLAVYRMSPSYPRTLQMTWSYSKLRNAFRILVRIDKRSRCARIRRTIWAEANLHFQAAVTLDCSNETAAMETEAQHAYINGHFISVLMISMAYGEHTLSDLGFASGKLFRERNKLEKVTEAVQELGIFNDNFWAEFERLQDIRNTYAHRKWVQVPVSERADDSLSERWAPHPLSLTARIRHPRKIVLTPEERDKTYPAPLTVMEKDAQDALLLMDSVRYVRHRSGVVRDDF